MSKQCELTGLKVLFGNSVSHAHNKTKRTFTPNIQKKSTYSECLDRMIRLNLSIKAIRSMDTAGGFDKYILSIPTKPKQKKKPKKKKNKY